MVAAKQAVLRAAAAARAPLDVEARPLLAGRPPSPPISTAGKDAPSVHAWLAVTVLAVGYLWSYVSSLQGGAHSRDLPYINAHLGEIGASIAAAVACLTAAIWAAGRLGATAWPARGALAAAHLLLLAWDHGGDFAHHGLYNWMLVGVMATPLNLALLGLYLWWSALTPRRFAASLAGAAGALALLAGLALVHFQHQAHRGFFGRSLVPGCAGRGCPRGAEPNCNFADTLPWIDLLPQGAQNFWTGSQRCQPVSGFQAAFTPGGQLSISGCPPGAPRSYTPLPSTLRWSTAQKTHERAAFQTNVLKRLKPEPYSQPVNLTDTEAVLARCGDAERLLTRVARRTQRLPPEPPLASSPSDSDAGPPRLNVLVLFMDSLGRRHFFRRMPRTAAALEALAGRKQGAASALHQFFRYHVVGMHTDPNSVPLYTGTPFGVDGAQPFWHAYRRAGYVSGSVYNLCEDWGTEYVRAPTPHDHELVAPFCLPEYHPVTPDGEPYRMFQGAFSILRRCLRGRHVHAYNLDYSRQFMAAYDGATPWLLLSSFHEGHEGTGEVVATVDADLAAFLAEQPPARLNRTAVVLVADHGATMGLNYMYTANGRITEHRIPMLALLLPRWAEALHPGAAAALAANEQRLTSHYDLHATLHHLLHLGEPAAPLEQRHARWAAAGNVSEAVRWGVSLLDEVPAGRRCDEAGIPPDWCQCFPPKA